MNVYEGLTNGLQNDKKNKCKWESSATLRFDHFWSSNLKHNWPYKAFDSSVDLAVVVAYDSVYLAHLEEGGGKNKITKYVDRDGLMVMWNSRKWGGPKWCFVVRGAAPDVDIIKCTGGIVCLMSERLHPTAMWSDALAKLSENVDAGWRCWLCVRCQKCCTRPRCS